MPDLGGALLVHFAGTTNRISNIGAVRTEQSRPRRQSAIASGQDLQMSARHGDEVIGSRGQVGRQRPTTMVGQVRSVGAGDLDGLNRGWAAGVSGQPGRDNLEAAARQLPGRAADSLREFCLAQRFGQGTAAGVAGANEDKKASSLRRRRYPRGAMRLNDRRLMYVGNRTVVHNDLLSRWKRGRLVARPAAGGGIVLCPGDGIDNLRP